MKTLNIYGLILLTSVTATHTFAQEVIASAKIANNPSEKAATTPAEAGVEEKQEDEPKFTFSGSVDTYFHTSFGSETVAPATSFANMKGFGLGMVNLIASYGGEKVGFTADLVFGPRGRDAVFANLYSEQSIINQAFAYYKISDKVTFNLGQFNTFLGYEVISPTVNFNYSTSYMFSYGPFNHTGLRADFELGGGLVAKLAIMNPTDLVEFNPVNTYTLGGQIGYTNEKGGIWFNALAGDQDGTLDYIAAGFNITDAFYLGVNTTYRTVAKGEVRNGDVISKADEKAKGFMGFAVYPKVTLSESFALGLRAEYFAVKNGYLSEVIALDEKGDGSVIDLTLSANYKVGALTIIPEVRVDSTSDKFYQKKNSDEYSKSLTTFTLAAVYKF
jgi:hypothetical protein